MVLVLAHTPLNRLRRNLCFPCHNLIARMWNIPETWPQILSIFVIFLSIPFSSLSNWFLGKHRSSIEKISSSPPQGISEEMNFISLKNSLQLSSSFFSSGQRKLGCEQALRTVAMVSPAVFELTNQIEDKKFGKAEGRSLLVLSSCPSDVLTYAVEIIFGALQLRMCGDDPHGDWLIAHLVVPSNSCARRTRISSRIFSNWYKLKMADSSTRYSSPTSRKSI